MQHCDLSCSWCTKRYWKWLKTHTAMMKRVSKSEPQKGGKRVSFYKHAVTSIKPETIPVGYILVYDRKLEKVREIAERMVEAFKQCEEHYVSLSPERASAYRVARTYASNLLGIINS